MHQYCPLGRLCYGLTSNRLLRKPIETFTKTYFFAGADAAGFAGAAAVAAGLAVSAAFAGAGVVAKAVKDAKAKVKIASAFFI